MEKYISNGGHEFVILSQQGKNCVIQFTNTGWVRKANIDNIKAGKVKDLFEPSVYGVGYYGEFEKNSYWKQAKQLWQNMHKRCYCEKDLKGYFGEAFVSRDWHCFSNFLSDISKLKNFDLWLKGQNGESLKYNLDKDLLIAGCKVYSKETCQFVSESENKADGATRGKPYTKKTRVAKE
ncbi:hypothetical protein vB_PsyM_KIL3b_0050 [Pseudomonas phage vB_PsyM_KIL3b]|uniref:Uncharacterized protein n=3 Tax=Pseudomonas phage vB_PsyM_KIL1 TaxID=1777065 RepID=A0A142IFW0_9CAUD|nr:HNH endonuclease [Pseudomonas phage vB_PsyM_KIL1]AMR57297.1 hypothetical protein vB_PsyM_KIL1_0050 [Pseudomonas phage vB_PsyM_KIL1]AMR57617.1 hypothetical protein vB_PsyM_KIL3_0050 [Pseudomonas phage vB_PsyM_KIL3]AMR58115.1 hypothetical protein vB_PsyM_KIL3b_0050 [Pseudomonas phage vB_PsyM_KIL3b]